ncbi:hypothetical protein [Sinimarinibacterium sp. NLF-5-8]|uniref:hypothetical protein n=1 Tax=Sinimarinibacterium sp. NLF-5-8 TaxID=2698684 RepID=UPI00137BCCB6|nr:hypothetical protein [Sinimarinibacterium sp. NLF-5-8]QHS09047.1 hypothetical protein GT972_02065 [Sinimarinibacterium sp. NLF-5-8]
MSDQSSRMKLLGHALLAALFVIVGLSSLLGPTSPGLHSGEIRTYVVSGWPVRLIGLCMTSFGVFILHRIWQIWHKGQ